MQKQRAIDLNKSFSHSKARYHQRRIKRAFRGGVSANFSRIRSAWIKFKMWVYPHLPEFITQRNRRKRIESVQEALRVAGRTDHQLDALPYIRQDSSHRIQHKK